MFLCEGPAIFCQDFSLSSTSWHRKKWHLTNLINEKTFWLKILNTRIPQWRGDYIKFSFVWLFGQNMEVEYFNSTHVYHRISKRLPIYNDSYGQSLNVRESIKLETNIRKCCPTQCTMVLRRQGDIYTHIKDIQCRWCSPIVASCNSRTYFEFQTCFFPSYLY